MRVMGPADHPDAAVKTLPAAAAKFAVIATISSPEGDDIFMCKEQNKEQLEAFGGGELLLQLQSGKALHRSLRATWRRRSERGRETKTRSTFVAFFQSAIQMLSNRLLTIWRSSNGFGERTIGSVTRYMQVWDTVCTPFTAKIKRKKKSTLSLGELLFA